MMEPWQDGTTEPGEWLGTRFVCRVSGAPADTVDGLRAERTRGVLARLLAAEQALHARREDLSAALFSAIGAAGDDKPLRNRLITLKRELYNLRPVAAARLDEALPRLDADAAARVRAFAALLDERAGLESAAREALAAETPELRRRFAALLDDADFRKGLMISSRSLYTALDRWALGARAAPAEVSGKEEKTERGLLRYYTRMAMKATPFSTFCAILPGAFVDEAAYGGEGTFRFDGSPRDKRSYVRINKFIYGLLFDHLKTRPAFRRALQVELNPTLREENGRLVFLTALEAREVFQRLANNEVLELITGSFRGLGNPTLGELIAALCADPQIEATEDEASAYLDKLIEIGFLRFHTGIREQDADWDLPFRALLARIDDPHAVHASTLLERLRDAVERYADAPVDARSAMIEEMHALLTGAIEAMEIEQRLRRDMPFYEDATSAARAEVPLTAGVRRAFDAWAEWTRMTSRVAWPRAEQATMRHFFDDYYGERRAVPLLVFYEDFYREHFKAHVEKEAKARVAAADPELKEYNLANPFRLDFVDRLSAARDRLGEAIRGKWRESPDAEEIDLAARDVEAALEGVANASHVCRSMGAFACLVPPADGGEPRLVLQGGSYTAGFGKYFSRFLYMLPDDVQAQVRRENAALTDELLAEICGDAQFNANLHPPLLRWEISYPTGESGAADEQLRSSDIVVEPDPDDANNLRLVHAPTGRRVIPVDLGFLNPRMRPPLYQLVSRFTPAAMFAPPVPESHERRQRPAPAEQGQAAVESRDAVEREAAAEKRPVAEGHSAEEAKDGEALAPREAGHDREGDGRLKRRTRTAESLPDRGRLQPQPGAEAAAPEAGAADPAPPPSVDAGAEPKPSPPPPRIVARPRVTYGGVLVLSRRRWMVPASLFPQREAHEAAADFFLRANRWRAETGIPETCYVRINPLPDAKPRPAGVESPADAEAQQAAAGEVPGYEAPVAVDAADEHEAEAADAPAEPGAEAAAEDGAPKPAAKPRTAQSRDFFKPQFIDFANPLLVGLLGKMAANLKSFTAIFEERLPAREALPTHDGRAYASEMVVQLYFPAGTSGTAAHALTGEEGHAAALA